MAITLNGTTGITTPDVDSTDLTATGNFTSRGIDDNATSTAMTLDSSGNLLVGKTTTSNLLTTAGHVFYGNGEAFLTRAGTPLFLGRTGVDGSIVNFYKDGTNVGSVGVHTNKLLLTTPTGSNTVVLGSTTDAGNSAGLYMYHSANSIIPFKSSDNSLPNGVQSLGHSNYRFKDLYLSGGVYLGGTGSANHLDDYEEGNWTPVGNHFNLSSVAHATYVKIGKTVTLQCWVNATNGSGSVIGAEITGLPFTSVTYSVGGVDVSSANSTIPRLHCRSAPNSTVLYFVKNNDEAVPAQDIDAGHIIFSITYETNS